MPSSGFFYSKLASTQAWINLSPMPFSASKRTILDLFASHIKAEYLPASPSHPPNSYVYKIPFATKPVCGQSSEQTFPLHLRNWKLAAVNSHQYSQLYGLLSLPNHASSLFTEGQRTDSLCFVSVIKWLQEPLVLPPTSLFHPELNSRASFS